MISQLMPVIHHLRDQGRRITMGFAEKKLAMPNETKSQPVSDLYALSTSEIVE